MAQSLMLRTAMLTGLIGLADSQQAGTVHNEQHPPINLKRCTKVDGCFVEPTSVTIDAQWRWLHDGSQSYHSCFEGVGWDPLHCTDPKGCARDCSLDGNSLQDYEKIYGVSTVEGGVGGLELKYVSGGSVGSRLYAMDERRGDHYKLWKLKNREFTFDVDVSSLSCGLNGALYFVEMPADGGLGVGSNNAGAQYGTGYCDAQCPHDLKFIDGEANVEMWRATATGAIGRFGNCCAELDIWEANRDSTAYTTHPCTIEGHLKCEGQPCGDTPEYCDCCDEPECVCCGRYSGVCDKDGCDYNSYRLGAHNFYGLGPHNAVDTSRPLTVVTQFLTSNGTDEGDLVEIRRLYVQDGKVINNSFATILGPAGSDSITGEFCTAQKEVFENPDDFSRKGGLKRMGEAMDRGMVLVLSLWDDGLTGMDWLDSYVGGGKFPKDMPGVLRGSCPPDSGRDIQELRKTKANAFVRYSNISYGEIGSTYGPGSERLIWPPVDVFLILVGIAVTGVAICGAAALCMVLRMRRLHRYSGESPRTSFIDSESGMKPLVSMHEQ